VLAVPAEDAAAELPPPTAPLHRYVSLHAGDLGATLISDGLAEYEAREDGTIAVTLVRAVGELSRDDLPERPGHAGWPAHVPGAQAIGPFTATFALLPHGARSPATLDEIERTTDDVLLPLRGRSLRSALEIHAPTSGVELHGEGLAFSACKLSENDQWIVLRCLNVTDERRAGEWRLGWTPSEIRQSRLDETPGEALPINGSVVGFAAGPHAVVTILAR
jgi:alpha-mannosidase